MCLERVLYFLLGPVPSSCTKAARCPVEMGIRIYVFHFAFVTVAMNKHTSAFHTKYICCRSSNIQLMGLVIKFIMGKGKQTQL